LRRMGPALLLLLLGAAAAASGAAPGCPSVCSCVGTAVDCARRGLAHVPPDLPPLAERM